MTRARVVGRRCLRQSSGERVRDQTDIGAARAAETRAFDILRGAFRTKHLKILRASAPASCARITGGTPVVLLHSLPLILHNQVEATNCLAFLPLPLREG